MFSFLKRKKESGFTMSFEALPDGKYVARFIEERGFVDQFILVVLEITRGEHKGTKIPMQFTNAKAKKVTRDYSGDWIARLAFEEDARASRLEDAIDYAKADTIGEFIVNYKEGYVTSVPEYDTEKVEKSIQRSNEQ